MYKTTSEIVKDWEDVRSTDWYAVDEICTDGRMLRLYVGDYDEAARIAVHKMTGGTVDYDGSVVPPGTFEAPFYRLAGVDEQMAHDYFFALANDVEDCGRMYTMAEAAEVMGITRQSVHGLIQRKTLPAEAVGGQWRISGASIAMMQPKRRTR